MKAPDGAIVPLMVSQKNVEATFGIPARKFREMLRDAPLTVYQHGQLKLVSAREFGEYLESVAEKVERVDVHGSTSVDDIAAATGLALVRSAGASSADR